jgi:hypothetical protein
MFSLPGLPGLPGLFAPAPVAPAARRVFGVRVGKKGVFSDGLFLVMGTRCGTQLQMAALGGSLHQRLSDGAFEGRAQ